MTPRLPSPPFWVAVTDMRGATLFEGHRDGRGRCRLTPLEQVANQEVEHERDRPSPRRARDGHSSANPGHEADELLHRHARHLCAWVADQMRTRKLADLHLFAPPRLLGALRSAAACAAPNGITLNEGDFAGLDAETLAAHPRFRSLATQAGAPVRRPPKRGD